MDLLMITGLTGLAVAWTSSLYFIVYYHVTSHWEDNYIGRNLMLLMGSLFLALTNSGLRAIWPDLPGRMIVGTILIWLIAIITVQRIFAFRRARREGRQTSRQRASKTREPSTASQSRQEHPESSQSGDGDTAQ